MLRWTPKSGLSYKIWTGKEYIDVSGSSYNINPDEYGCYSLMAVSRDGVCSELSQPIVVSPKRVTIQAESGTVSSQSYVSGGYVTDKRNQSAQLTIDFNAQEKGTYLLSGVYNNPGDATSGVSCAIRSVYVDGVDKGTLVFPEVYSNHTDQTSTHLSLQLDKGIHRIKIFYDSANWHDRNMSLTNNTVYYNCFVFDLVKSEEQPTTGEPTQPASETQPVSTTEVTEPSSETQPVSTSEATEPSSGTQPTEPESTSQITEPATTAVVTTEPVSTAPVAPSPKISKTKATLNAGKELTLKVTNGTVKSWTSSNSKVATVKNGKVTALKRGAVNITAKLSTGDSLTCKVVIKTSPKLSKKTVTVKKGKVVSVKIIGKAKSVNNTYKSTKTAKIISKKTASKIKIKGLKKGRTTLKIKANGVLLKLKVKVK